MTSPSPSSPRRRSSGQVGASASGRPRRGTAKGAGSKEAGDPVTARPGGLPAVLLAQLAQLPPEDGLRAGLEALERSADGALLRVFEPDELAPGAFRRIGVAPGEAREPSGGLPDTSLVTLLRRASAPSLDDQESEKPEAKRGVGEGQRRTLVSGGSQYEVRLQPHWDSGGIRVFCCAVSAPGRPLPPETEAILAEVVLLVLYHDLRQVALNERRLFGRLGAFVDLMGRSASEPDFEGAMERLVDDLGELLGCARIGIAQSTWRGFRLVGFTGQSPVKRGGEVTNLVEEAIAEVRTRGHGVVRGGEGDATDSEIQTPAIEALCAHFEAKALVLEFLEPLETVTEEASAPGQEGEGEASVSAKRSRDRPMWLLLWREVPNDFAEKRRFLDAIGPELAKLLPLMRQGKLRGPAARLRRALSSADPRIKRWALGAGVAILLGLLWPVPFPIKGEAEVKPLGARTVSVPFDGILDQSFVSPGEEVSEGQVLAQLEAREIEFRLADLRAQRSRSLKRGDVHRSAGELAESQMALLDAEALGQEIEVLEYRQDHLRIRAPVAGVVLQGDLEEVEGAALRTGEALFEISPLDRIRVEVAIADRDVSLVREGMAVGISLAAQPGEPLEAEILRLSPMARIAGGRNVFIAEVEVDNREAGLRPGMQGKATVKGDRRPWAWRHLRGAWHGLRYWAW